MPTKPKDVTEIKLLKKEDVMKILGVGRDKALSIIRTINAEQAKNNKIVVKGKVTYRALLAYM